LYNNGVLIPDDKGDVFIQQIINCQNNVEQAEKELAAHKKTITFLEEQYAKLKA